MNARRYVALVVAGLLLAACATPYQSVGFSGGFRETQLAPDVYRVTFSGNAYTSADRVQDFALLRAAELTLANKARYFAVVTSADQSTMHMDVSPGSSYTTGRASSYGNTTHYAGTTTYRAPQVNTYYKPGVGMMIRTFETKPEGGFVFDAHFIASSIRTKYGIK